MPKWITQVTQLGHVKDLATAFVKCLGNKKAYNQIYNVAGAWYSEGPVQQAEPWGRQNPGETYMVGSMETSTEEVCLGGIPVHCC